AGANRLRPADLVHAGRTHTRFRRDEMVDEDPHHDAAGHPAAGDEPAVDRLLGSLVIDVERLRVVPFRELDDLVLGDQVVTELKYFPGAEILEVTLFRGNGHGRGLRWRAASNRLKYRKARRFATCAASPDTGGRRARFDSDGLLVPADA